MSPQTIYRGHGQMIGAQMQTVIAIRHERGETPEQTARAMKLPVAAVKDIVATFEHRAERFFRSTRG